jgi:hypothetical protein
LFAQIDTFLRLRAEKTTWQSIFSTLGRSFQDCAQLQRALNMRPKEQKLKRKIKSLPVVVWSTDMVRQTMSSGCLFSHFFSSMQDNKLVDGMCRHGPDGWTLIAASVDTDISGDQCLARCDEMTDRLRAAPFTAEEVIYPTYLFCFWYMTIM